MGLQQMIERLRNHPESHRIGMIASHLGVVRGTSLKGFRVSGIDVAYDQADVKEIVNQSKALDGIVDVLVETYEGHLEVGDEILAVAVAGETRETVFPALMRTVDRIKAEAVRKRERPVAGDLAQGARSGEGGTSWE
jgi:molybdopterin synthase catalytic subunit